MKTPDTEPVRSVGIIGSRKLAYQHAKQVGAVVDDLVSRDYHIATGGAVGADQYVVEQLLRQGISDKGTVYAAWRNYTGFPVQVRAMIRQFRDQGGHILWGASSGKEEYTIVKMGLLLRNKRLVDACYGLVAFIDPHSRGSIFTLKKATEKRQVVVVFPHDCDLPTIHYVKWVPLRCGGCWEGGYKAVYLK